MRRRSSGRLPRRAGPATALLLLLVAGGISLWQAWDTSRHLRSEARQTSRIYGKVVAALTDTVPGTEAQALLELVSDISETGIPLVVTDLGGTIMAGRNVPFENDLADPAAMEFLRELGAYSDPIEVAGVGRIFFGPNPATRRLRWVPMLQLVLLLAAVLAGVWALRTAVARDRDRIWVAMARESAHQLGTPLMSARAWLDRLEQGDTDTGKIAAHLSADVVRLERVAQRFERIGRPARRDSVALGALAEKTAQYFEPRLPRHANPVSLKVKAPSAGPMIAGDPVLLGWALETLVRNAIDALSGRGGSITIAVEGNGKTARFSVEDDGPGIDAKVRSAIFEPGVTTKSAGWGIGLPLARRIVEEVHGGRLDLVESARGARFVAQIPVGGHES